MCPSSFPHRTWAYQGGGDRIVREPERRQITGISKSEWRRRALRKEVPEAVQLGPHSVGWSFRELQDYVSGLLAARD
jgi:predicted DNA-binding transcriptional regulator AlpA